MKAALTLIILIASLLLPARAEACSCAVGTPICETFWRTSAVFAGEVIAITDVMPANSAQSSGIPARRRIRFRVDAAYRGGAVGEVDVYTGVGGGDCGFTFFRGEKYLVFASGFEGRLTTGACSPTQMLAAAGPTLAYVSQTFAPSAGGRIYGNVQLNSGTAGAFKPARGYRVSLRSPARTWTATSDRTGAYEFTGVPAGKYTIEVTVPEALRVFGPSGVELVDARGCKHADFIVAPDGRNSRLAHGIERPLRVRLHSSSEKEMPTSGQVVWDTFRPGRPWSWWASPSASWCRLPRCQSRSVHHDFAEPL